MAKKGVKRKQKSEMVEEEESKVVLPLVRRSDEPVIRKVNLVRINIVYVSFLFTDDTITEPSRWKRFKFCHPTYINNSYYKFQTKWINRERVLVFATRGISFQHRHLMKDIMKMLPHSKPSSKMERKENLFVVNEVC